MLPWHNTCLISSSKVVKSFLSLSLSIDIERLSWVTQETIFIFDKIIEFKQKISIYKMQKWLEKGFWTEFSIFLC